VGEPARTGCLSVALPAFGLASAGGFVGFFGGFWVLPADWWPVGVVAGVAGGAVAGVLLSRRGGHRPPGSQDTKPGAAADGGAR
jgi:hypothetical protein